MYLVNTHLKGKDSFTYPEDFPMLKNNKRFAMVKQGDDFIIQTIENDNKKLKMLVEKGEKELNERIEQGKKTAEKLLNFNSYTFSVS